MDAGAGRIPFVRFMTATLRSLIHGDASDGRAYTMPSTFKHGTGYLQGG